MIRVPRQSPGKTKTMISIKRYIRSLLCAIAFCAAPALCAVAPDAYAQSVDLTTQESEIHSGMPFELSIVLTGFQENPQPEIDDFEIENAKVQFLGVSPRVSSMVSIINGRRTERKDVTFYYNYQITPKVEGVYTIPAIRAHQGATEAVSQRMTFTARSVPTTQDMKIELQVPDRRLWVGETFEATLVWYLRKDVANQDFSVPILEMPETFDVSEPDRAMRGQAVTLRVGSRQMAFPFNRDNVMLGGLEYTRFSIPLHITPLKSGVISIPASQVTADLATGTTRDIWGFGRSSYETFKAVDRDRSCTVREIPSASRPASFTNAMGSDYSISVTADRTIIKAGDPLELTIEISSPSALDGLILPNLGAAGLNEQLFGIPSDTPIGETIDGGSNRNIKRFRIPVRVKSDRVTEVPPIAFSYFNPKTEEFTTVRSQPIALSVTAVNTVGAADVISGFHAPSAPSAPAATTAAPSAPVEAATAAGALELNLLSDANSLQATHHRIGRPVRLAIYAFPFVVWIALFGIRRLRRSRQADSEQRRSAVTLRDALRDAANLAPRDAAASITNALRGFLSATDSPRAPFQDVCERIDAEAYRPNAGSLSPDLVSELRETAKTHVNPKFAKLVSGILAALLAIVLAFAPATSDAQTPQPAAQTQDDTALLATAQQIYHDSMQATERADRIDGLKRAYAMLDDIASRHPDSAEILVDCGNAALGIADFGHAALAYQRALALDPSLEQAQNNLAYIRSVQGDTARESRRILSTAFFLNDTYSRDTRLLIAAILFAIGILLVIPWNRKARRILCYLSVFPFILWIWMLASAFVENEKNEAVVMSEVFLKTADNAGASNVSATPIEPGYTVTVIKTAGDWTQIQTRNGTRGWVSKGTIERI